MSRPLKTLLQTEATLAECPDLWAAEMFHNGVAIHFETLWHSDLPEKGGWNTSLATVWTSDLGLACGKGAQEGPRRIWASKFKECMEEFTREGGAEIEVFRKRDLSALLARLPACLRLRSG